MADDRLVGVALLVGLAAFMVGAVRWRIVYEGPPETALPAIHADRRRRAWIHSWMIAGLLVTSSGLAGLVTVVATGTPRAVASMSATAYGLGALCMVVSLAYRLAVVPWAAAHAGSDGRPPDGFVAWDAWAGTLYRIHMLTSYLTFALLGVSILNDTDLPTALGWLGLAWGLTFATGFAVPGRHQVAFFPPFWALTYPAVVGATLLAG
jgi:hypothetical protein